ncbi:MAG TPA: outer membrane lipoprotein carrier protein LolA [Burkholderiales bacterium]|nr:outer membrane lipoprotein carrier protein LolA [Burkholderiales bacterium]
MKRRSIFYARPIAPLAIPFFFSVVLMSQGLCRFPLLDAMPAPCLVGTQNDLDTILAKMDQTAARYHSVEAKFSWTMYNSVVDEKESPETGRIFIERNGDQVKMAADIEPPDEEQVVLSEGKIQVYKPRLAAVDVYDAGTHREEVETFLALGFLSSGNEMRKSFDVKYEGLEKVENGIEAAKLDLTPKAENVKNHVPEIILWINPEDGTSVQQKLIETNGDYRLANYSNIQLGKKISPNVFKLKTHGNATITNH